MKKNLFKNLFIYEKGNTFIRFLIYLKYKILGNDMGECKVPDSVIDSFSRLFLPDIQAFFESGNYKKVVSMFVIDRDVQ